MWLARNSAVIQPVLVEIESPSKRWIAGRGRDARPHGQLTQALNQLRQRKEWLDKPANGQVLRETYGIPAEWRAMRPLRPRYMLITGRRSENPTEIAKLRDLFGRDGFDVLTYDNLPQPNYWCRNYLTRSGNQPATAGS